MQCGSFCLARSGFECLPVCVAERAAANSRPANLLDADEPRPRLRPGLRLVVPGGGE